MGKISEIFNFDNIGGKIKTLAKWSCWITILLIWIVAPIAFFALLSGDGPFAIIPLLGAIVLPVFVWVGSWAMYAFGEFVEDTHAMRSRMGTVEEAPVEDEFVEDASAEETPESSFQYSVRFGKAKIKKFKGKETRVAIPSTVEGCPVTTIGDGAFYNCTGLTRVMIPNSVTSIGNDAFSYCVNLREITIPDSVTETGEYVFYKCAGLKTVYFASEAQKTRFASCFPSTATLVVK